MLEKLFTISVVFTKHSHLSNQDNFSHLVIIDIESSL